MKRMLILPLLAIVAMVSQVQAACALGGSVVSCCRWEGDAANCHPIDPSANDTQTKKSDQECRDGYGEVVTDCNAASSGVWCDYGAPSADGDGGCYWNLLGQIDCESKTGVVRQKGYVGAGGTCGTGGGNPNPGGSDPIIPTQTIVNLVAMFDAGILAISSTKDASVKLFDMQGSQVFSKKVSAGYNTVSFENQKQGVYYAVVTSGSNVQTVKVLLK